MPSVCGACGRRCRCACRHRRKLCITSCSAARRQTRSPTTMRCAWRRRRCCWRSLASRSTRLAAPSRASPCRRIPRRVSPKLGSDPHARRSARAAIAASAVRTYSMIDSVDDAGSGAPSSIGRRLMRALASLASTSLYSDVRKRAQATLQDVVDARILDARTLVDPIVDLLAAKPQRRGARTREGARRACRRRAAHADTAGGHTGHHAAHATPAAADDGLHARRQV
jgi:hypothetical protein